MVIIFYHDIRDKKSYDYFFYTLRVLLKICHFTYCALFYYAFYYAIYIR